MQIVSVKNWEKFQHYKDRTPPWIKLYFELLDDYAFGALPDSAKAHLLLIWLLASRLDNKLPADPLWIARRIGASEPVNLQCLIDSGFLVASDDGATCKQDASSALADCKQSACPETETEKRQRRPPPLSPKGEKPATAAAQIELPEALDCDAFRQAWGEWLAYRRERRLTMTPRTLNKQFALLAGYGLDGALASIEKSISSGWQSINPPRPADIAQARADHAGDLLPWVNPTPEILAAAFGED